MKILQKIQYHYDQDLPFVAYKKPNELQVSVFFQQTKELFYTRNYTETGFVFAPFDDKKNTILIPKNQSEFLQEQIDFEEVINNETLPVINKKDKEFHCKIVDNAIQNIVDNQFRKVVLSRKESVDLVDFNIIETFKRLVVNYSRAMVYIWFHPKVGLWLGATPETLVKINGNEFETMSLAGTKVDIGEEKVIWSDKEIDEQQVVTDYIADRLRSICEEVFISEVETIKAGSLLHLKTKITGKLKGQSSKLITLLHPTPAICGFPKEKTKDYILKIEQYEREFYTGFLGELNFKSSAFKGQKSELFVNLRCMQIKNEKALIYVGGGITKDSNSEKEWEETVAKSKIMKSIL